MHRRKGLGRSPDAARNAVSAFTRVFDARHSRHCQGQVAPGGTFPEECCFQVIYFVSNIYFVSPAE
jgi:hypothetical protein